MPWELDNDRPIYLQLMERIQQDIVDIHAAGSECKLPQFNRGAEQCTAEHRAPQRVSTAKGPQEEWAQRTRTAGSG